MWASYWLDGNRLPLTKRRRRAHGAGGVCPKAVQNAKTRKTRGKNKNVNTPTNMRMIIDQGKGKTKSKGKTKAKGKSRQAMVNDLFGF